MDDEKTLEYHYDLRETIKTFNDYLCIVFLNLANILIYPNETFYKKYVNNQFRIEADTALHMANKICKRMQDEFTDIILENFPIRETVARISRAEKEAEDVFDTREVIPKQKIKSQTREAREGIILYFLIFFYLFRVFFNAPSCLLNVKYILFNLKSGYVFDEMSRKR